MPKFRFMPPPPTDRCHRRRDVDGDPGRAGPAPRPQSAADLDPGEEEHPPVRDHAAQGQEAGAHAPVPPARGVRPLRRVGTRGPGGPRRGNLQQAPQERPRRHAASLEAGARFSEAAAEHPNYFPTIRVEILRSAELTGNLDERTRPTWRLSGAGDRHRPEGQVGPRLPAIVMGLAIVVSTVLVVYVLPKFRSFFTSLHAKLPLPTRMLLAVAKWIGHWGLTSVRLIVALVVAAPVGGPHRRRAGRSGIGSSSRSRSSAISSTPPSSSASAGCSHP